MSFIKPEGIMNLIEDLLSTTLAQTVPRLKFTPPPFPRMEYKAAIEKVYDSFMHTVHTNQYYFMYVCT
jgi:aspartyl-tRNA synthetase